MSAPIPAPLRLAGYAAIFGRRDNGGDVILPGAFARTLAEHRALRDPIPLFWQHRPEQRVGWVDSAEEDGRGLRVIAHFDNPGAASAALVRAGAVRGMSFGYRVTSARRTPQGRDLIAVDLIEVSVVTRPMQAFAQIHLVTA